MNLKQFNVTVVRFDPTKPFVPATAETFVLPVDSPDEEHAISAAMSNCVAFTPKFQGREVTPIAFTCTAIVQR